MSEKKQLCDEMTPKSLLESDHVPVSTGISNDYSQFRFIVCIAPLTVAANENHIPN